MPNPDEEAEPRRSTEPAEKPAGAATGPTNPLHEDEEWDEVDEASWESFPASDAPARWAGSDHPTGEEEGEDG